MRKRCLACPFRDGENEEATQAQNLGCLPTPAEMIDKFDSTGVAMSCHDNEKVPCAGLSKHRDTSNSGIQPYSDWYREG